MLKIISESDLATWIEKYNVQKVWPRNDEYDKKFKMQPEKAALAIDKMSKLPVDLRRAVCISVGGADGSDIIEILRKTDINFGVLVEYSPAQCEIAKEHAKECLPKHKVLRTFEGDAGKSLGHCRALLDDWIKQHNLHTCAIVAMATLHELELPERSRYVNYDEYFGTLYRGFPNRMLFSREPSAPTGTGWSSPVRFRLASSEFNRCQHFDPEIVTQFCKFIAMKNKIGAKGIFSVTDDYVQAPAAVACEAIRRMLQISSEEHFRYEMDEFHSGFRPSNLKRRLKQYFLSGNVDIQPCNSDTFEKAYREAKVEVCSARNSGKLERPHVFSNIVAIQVEKSVAATEQNVAAELARCHKKVQLLWRTAQKHCGDLAIMNDEGERSSAKDIPKFGWESLVRLLRQSRNNDYRVVLDLLSHVNGPAIERCFALFYEELETRGGGFRPSPVDCVVVFCAMSMIARRDIECKNGRMSTINWRRPFEESLAAAGLRYSKKPKLSSTRKKRPVSRRARAAQ